MRRGHYSLWSVPPPRRLPTTAVRLLSSSTAIR
jgi:hypothetical protein